MGYVVPGVDLRIDESSYPGDREKSQRAEGEIQAKGPGVFAQYHNLPDKTGEAFTGDGYFRTGDLGWIDRRGYLHITGRRSTLIVTEGGENVQPDQVEDALVEHPVIREAAVLQVGGRLVAVVVPEPGEVRRGGGEIDRAVREAVAERSRTIPSYQRPAEVAISRNALPRTRLGKIRRHLLAKIYDEARRGIEKHEEAPMGPIPIDEMSDQDRVLLDNSVAHQVWELLAVRYADHRLTPDTSPQLDLGVDSMEWLNITLEIGQHTGVELSEEAIGRIETVRDLLQEAAEGSGGGGVSQEEMLDRPERMLSEQQKRWLSPLGPVRRALAYCLYLLNVALMKVFCRLRVEGLERLPEGKFVLTPNHTSYLDPFVLGAALPYRQLRTMYWAGWTGIAFRNMLFRGFSRLAQVVPIDPDRGAFSSLAIGAAVLSRGRNLAWFPEGHRSLTGELDPFRPGLGILLNHPSYRDAWLVPVYIEGGYQAWPPGHATPRPGRIRVIFGEPVAPETLRDEGEGEEPHERMMNALHDRVRDLAPS